MSYRSRADAIRQWSLVEALLDATCNMLGVAVQPISFARSVEEVQEFVDPGPEDEEGSDHQNDAGLHINTITS